MNASADGDSGATAQGLYAGRSWGIRLQFRLARKELRETLRDRRTIVTLVLMPVLVYPLLSVAFQKLLLASLQPAAESSWVVAFESEADADIVSRYINEGGRILSAQSANKNDSQRPQPADGDPAAQQESEESPNMVWREVMDAQAAVSDLSHDLGVRVSRTQGAPRRSNLPPIACELLFRENSPNSAKAADYFESRLRAVNDDFIVRRLGSSLRLPVQIGRSTVESEIGENVSLATLVPLILILMTITGAVYPAIDLTAGERERGTLETLVAAPAPRMSLLLAKYVAVVAVAMMTATINLAAMLLTVFSAGLGPLVFGETGFSAVLVVQVFGLLCIFAAFFSAILLAITSFARSFKEAQAYLIPLMLMSLAPGFLSLMPGLELNGFLAVTPLVNIVLLSRDVLNGQVYALPAALTVTSTALYAFAAIAVAARIFGTDAVLYGGEGGWAELFRRPAEYSDRPTMTNAVFCLAMLFPLFIVLSGRLALLDNTGIETRLIYSSAITILIFGGVPLASAAYSRVRVGRGFQLRGASPLVFLGAMLLGLACWPFAHEIFLAGERLGLVQLDQRLIESIEKLLAEIRSAPLVVVLLTIAVTPAVLEEFFFRGYLFNAFRGRFRPWTVVLLTAALFGAFHVVVSNSPTVRFLPTTFMGIVLGWICLRSGSVYPGMLLHVCHNGLLISMAYYRTELQELGIGVEETEHLPKSWLIGAGLVVALGVALVTLATRRKSTKTSPAPNLDGQENSNDAE